ncbi:MAG: insulinase family protein, partial [Candidatus Obscuribacterales bacterium]|nr:insulinase family protein [Candidatus Obscuribacterales bacterium]
KTQKETKPQKETKQETKHPKETKSQKETKTQVEKSNQPNSKVNESGKSKSTQTSKATTNNTNKDKDSQNNSKDKSKDKSKEQKKQPAKTKQGKLPDANGNHGGIALNSHPFHLELAAYTTNNSTPLLPTEPKIETKAEEPKTKPEPKPSPAPSIPPAPEPTFAKAETRSLVNGLNLILFESHLNPIVQIRGLVKAGESYDPAGKKGSSDVVTALLNAGSTKRNRQQTELLQEDLGLPPHAMLHFANDYDNIYFESRCLSNDLPTALGLVADALQSMPMQDQDIEKAKKDAAQSLRTSDQLTANRIYRTMLKDFVLPNSAYYPTELIDKDQQINKLTSADLKAFAGQRVIAPLTTIVITGDINIDQAQKLVEKLFANYGGKAQLGAHSLQLSSRKALRTSLPLSDNSPCVVTLGQLIPISYDDARYADMVIADCILSKHPMFSRLGKRLTREPQQGLSTASVDMQTNTQPLSNKYTAWFILTEVSPKLVAAALGSLQTEVKQLSKGGISNPELSETKQFLLGNIPVKNMSSLSSLSKTLLEAEKQDADPNYTPQLLNSIKSASLESVNKFIKSSMRPDQAVLIIAGPDEALRAARRQFTTNDRLERSKTEKKTNSSKTSIELVP